MFHNTDFLYADIGHNFMDSWSCLGPKIDFHNLQLIIKTFQGGSVNFVLIQFRQQEWHHLFHMYHLYHYHCLEWFPK